MAYGRVVERLTGALRANRALCWGIAAVIVLAGVVPEFMNPVNGDTAWFLRAAERLLEGDRLYVDVIEINPPLFIWLDTIPVAVARALDVSAVTVFRVGMVGLLLASAGLCRALLARLVPDVKGYQRVLVLLLLFVLFPLARSDFGQREHIILALVLPYVMLAACRAGGRPIGAWYALGLGVLAGVGMALKPFYLLMWIGLAAWHWFTLPSVRSVGRPELLGAAMVPILYPVAAAVVSPEYFEFVRQFGLEYANWGSNSPVFAALMGDGSWVAIGALAAYLLVRSAVTTPRLWDSVAIAVAAAFLCAVLQQKGWRYHFYPALAMGVFLMAGISLEIAGRQLATPVRRSAALLALAGTLTMLTTTAFAAVRAFADGLNWERTMMGRLIEWTKLQTDQRLLMIDAGGIEASVAYHSDKIPVSRVANVYALDTTYAGPSSGNTHRPGVPLRRPSVAVRTTSRMTLEDFRRGDPLLVMFDEPQPDRADLLNYFGRDPAFAEVFSRYTFLGTIEGKQAFRRLRPGETRVQRPLPLVDPAPDPVLVGFSLRRRRLPVFLGFLLVLSYGEFWHRRRIGKHRGPPDMRGHYS